MKPETTNIAPATHIGTDVAKFAYNAMTGAYMQTKTTVSTSERYPRRQVRNNTTHHDTEYPVRTSYDRIASPSILGGE
jgi:hypothetical protein